MDHIGHAATSFLCPRARARLQACRDPLPFSLLIRARHVGASRALAEHRCYLAARQGRQRCRYSLYRCAARVAGFLSTLSPRSLGRHRNHTFIYKPTATPRPTPGDSVTPSVAPTPEPTPRPTTNPTRAGSAAGAWVEAGSTGSSRWTTRVREPARRQPRPVVRHPEQRLQLRGEGKDVVARQVIQRFFAGAITGYEQ